MGLRGRVLTAERSVACGSLLLRLIDYLGTALCSAERRELLESLLGLVQLEIATLDLLVVDPLTDMRLIQVFGVVNCRARFVVS